MKVLLKDRSIFWDSTITEEEKNIKDSFKISLSSSILSCSFTLGEINLEKSFSINLADNKNLAIEVNLLSLDNPYTLAIYPCFTSYSFANRLPGKQLNSPDIRIMRIYVNKDGTDCDIHLLTSLASEVEGLVNVIIPEDYSHTKAMKEYSEYGKNILEKVKKKSALLGNLDNGNSIAYLEAQVDVLTRYVLNKHMNDIDDEELRAILLAANSHSILDIKSKEKLIEEMKHKAHTRQEQLKYYANN